MDTQQHCDMLNNYFQLMAMNGATRVYQTAHSLGIFRALTEEPATVAHLAKVCALQEEPLELLTNSLCAIGTICKEDGLCRLSPVMQLLTGPYQHLGDEYWNVLPEVLRTGRPGIKMDHVDQSEALYTKQAQALAWMMQPAAHAAAKILGVGDQRKNLNILDVGAGAGVWSLSFAHYDSQAQVTALDWPEVLKVAEASAQSQGLGGRLQVLPGNYHEVALAPEAFDMAVVGNVTHLESPRGVTHILKRIRASLKTKGEIVVIDVMPGQTEGDLNRSLYALGLALRTENGRVHSVEDLKDMLETAGFKGVNHLMLPVPPYTMGMLIARE